ncbi:MAG: CDP-diacylglycerol--serine O-phosphatidyltransferase [Syntrophobacteraceae bacterium CG07_land_8_20_14_0_80_61_8]|nr:MAG: CDP-diacylglycerol--serine O-phosphatidyltransferase [Syntrophobacteraceae bacterium CG07_land_8_20_14_0_80_61_8]
MSTEMKFQRSKRRRSGRRRSGEVRKGTYILPNLFTTGNLFAGFYGIVCAIDGRYETAAVAILVSCLFDILDGKVARFTRATSRFGVEYDSLADLVAFGVGPAVLMYLWALKPFGRLGWLAAFVFVACGALRLARFNVQVDSVSKKCFVGLPIPGGAGMVATTVLFLHHLKGPEFDPSSIFFVVFTYLLGFLMVSNVPYNSFKELEVIKGKPLPTLFVVVVLLTVVAARPHIMLFSLGVAYVISGPLGLLTRMVKQPTGEAEEADSGPALTDQPKENDQPL